MKQLSLPRRRYQKRKVARAISLKGANHITLRANAFVLRRHHSTIKEIIVETQKRYEIKLRAIAIMSNHLHLVTKVPSREAFANALRFLASRIALKIGHGKIWAERSWSRPITTRADLKNVTAYVWNNPLKAKTLNAQVDSYWIFQGLLLATEPTYITRERNASLRSDIVSSQLQLTFA